jgi:hypothetical protein
MLSHRVVTIVFSNSLQSVTTLTARRLSVQVVSYAKVRRAINPADFTAEKDDKDKDDSTLRSALQLRMAAPSFALFSAYQHFELY